MGQNQRSEVKTLEPDTSLRINTGGGVMNSLIDIGGPTVVGSDAMKSSVRYRKRTELVPMSINSD